MTGTNDPDRLLRLREVMHLVGLSRAGIYRQMQAGRFPRPVKLGEASAWPLSDIMEVIERAKTVRDTTSN